MNRAQIIYQNHRLNIFCYGLSADTSPGINVVRKYRCNSDKSFAVELSYGRPPVVTLIPPTWLGNIVAALLVVAFNYRYSPAQKLGYIDGADDSLEPARPKAYAPKAYVYTNFTTSA